MSDILGNALADRRVDRYGVRGRAIKHAFLPLFPVICSSARASLVGTMA